MIEPSDEEDNIPIFSTLNQNENPKYTNFETGFEEWNNNLNFNFPFRFEEETNTHRIKWGEHYKKDGNFVFNVGAPVKCLEFAPQENGDVFYCAIITFNANEDGREIISKRPLQSIKPNSPSLIQIWKIELKKQPEFIIGIISPQTIHSIKWHPNGKTFTRIGILTIMYYEKILLLDIQKEIFDKKKFIKIEDFQETYTCLLPPLWQNELITVFTFTPFNPYMIIIGTNLGKIAFYNLSILQENFFPIYFSSQADSPIEEIVSGRSYLLVLDRVSNCWIFKNEEFQRPWKILNLSTKTLPTCINLNPFESHFIACSDDSVFYLDFSGRTRSIMYMNLGTESHSKVLSLDIYYDPMNRSKIYSIASNNTGSFALTKIPLMIAQRVSSLKRSPKTLKEYKINFIENTLIFNNPKIIDNTGQGKENLIIISEDNNNENNSNNSNKIKKIKKEPQSEEESEESSKEQEEKSTSLNKKRKKIQNNTNFDQSSVATLQGENLSGPISKISSLNVIKFFPRNYEWISGGGFAGIVVLMKVDFNGLQ